MRHVALQAFGSRGRASYMILRSVGFYVFNSIGPFATIRHVHVTNSASFLDFAVSKGRCVVGLPDVPSERRTLPSVFGLAVRKVGGNPNTFHSLHGMSVIVTELKLLSRSSSDILAMDYNKAVVMYRLYNAAVNVNELPWNGINIRAILTSETPSVSKFILLIIGTFVVSVRMASNSTSLGLGL